MTKSNKDSESVVSESADSLPSSITGSNRSSHQTAYKDYSQMGADSHQTSSYPLSASVTPPPSGPTGGIPNEKEPTFPVKLHMILSNPEYEDIIAWLPHGRSWRILQQKAFEEEVIPKYFRHGRYASFARQVNGWGFRRITHGSDYNSYYHELFLRGRRHLCHRMKRLTTKDVANRKKSNEEIPTPDFYSMPALPDSKKPSTQIGNRGNSPLTGVQQGDINLANRFSNPGLGGLSARLGGGLQSQVETSRSDLLQRIQILGGAGGSLNNVSLMGQGFGTNQLHKNNNLATLGLFSSNLLNQPAAGNDLQTQLVLSLLLQQQQQQQNAIAASNFGGGEDLAKVLALAGALVPQLNAQQNSSGRI